MLSHIEQGSAPVNIQAADQPPALSAQPVALSPAAHLPLAIALPMMSPFNAIVPMACVTAAAIAAMIAEAFRVPGERMPIAPLGVIGLLGAALACLALWDHNTSSFGLVSADKFGLFVTGVLIVVGLLSLALSAPTIDREHLPRGEYYALMLFALAGMMLMATATDLLVIFLALEVLSIAVYVLTGIRRDSPSRRRRRSSIFCLARFRARFSCTASRSSTGSPAAPGSIGSARDGGAGAWRRRRCSCSRSGCCWWALRSRCRRCRSTCGRLTPTKARRRRSPVSCPRASRRRRSRRSPGCF